MDKSNEENAKETWEKEINNIPFWSGYLFKDNKINISAIPTLIPFINFIYDLIFDDTTPSPESTKSLLDILGLLNALLLASETGIMASVTYTDLNEVDIRFGNSTNGYGTFWKDTYNGYENNVYVAPSAYFYYRVGLSVCLLFVSVLMVVYVYADMAGKHSNVSEDEVSEEVTLGAKKTTEGELIIHKRRKSTIDRKTTTQIQNVKYDGALKDYDEMKKKVNQLKDLQLFCAWWKFAKYSIILILVTTIAGCCLCVYSISILLLIKYPDHYVEVNGHIISSTPQCPTGMLEKYFIIIIVICGSSVLLSCGAGTANAQYFQFKVNERNKIVSNQKDLQQVMEIPKSKSNAVVPSSQQAKTTLKMVAVMKMDLIKSFKETSN